jgi:divalent metal cation (Fe/Co/Zn/Cd) transporter
MTTDAGRAVAVLTGVRLAAVTVVWMVAESTIALAAGVIAGSALLTAFGLDSVIELLSGSVLLWRLSVEARGADVERVERVEHRATWFAAVMLALLCLYVLVTSIVGLAAHSKPGSSTAGIVITVAAVIVMPWLGVSKRRIAARIGSDALRADAAESFTCGYMAAAVLVGVALNTLFHWWWAEDIAALVFLFWLVGETREALEEAREGPGDDEEQTAGRLPTETS